MNQLDKPIDSVHLVPNNTRVALAGAEAATTGPMAWNAGSAWGVMANNLRRIALAK